MAEDQDKSQQTEDATPKKEEDARKKGQVASSKEPSTALSFLFIAALGISGVGALIVNVLTDVMREFLSGKVVFDATGAGVQTLFIRLSIDLAKTVLPVAIPLMILGALVTVLVTGPVFSFDKIKPKFDSLNIIKGIGNMFTLKSVAELVKSVIKIAVISLACWMVIQGMWAQMFQSMQKDPINIAWLAVSGIMQISGVVAVIFVFVALADVIYQRFEHAKSLKMSMKEIKDETKESEGDPQLKAKIRQVQMEQARSRMMSDVPGADVIITNPTHLAVALLYDQDSFGAPQLVAKGKGLIAAQIRSIAKEHDVPIQENKPLARSLYKQVKLGEAIPEHLYEAVAIVLAEVFKMKRK